VLVLKSLRVPGPVLVRAPAPSRTPRRDNIPSSTNVVPPLEVIVIARSDEKVPEVCRVPPSNVSPPLVCPRFALEVILRGPVRKIVPPL
jgi:hypothetical protein